ncbi:MAG TPA: RNA methyltransferase [Accumulibacter sp.]|nr:RNA methyltransferase [Accumulibacter sp.]HPP47007.1 RNA methyltransferase [Accumulibacter sp.]
MPLIASRDNAHFKMLRKLLASGRERRQSGQVILDGLHLLETYCAQQGVPDEVLLSESGAIRPEIAAWLQTAANGLRVSVFSDALFKQLSVVETPSGIMAVVRPPSPLPLAERADSVLLDGIQDPGNLGSLLRSAAAAGFRQVLLSNDCAQVWSPKTLRAAMGAHFLLSLHENVDLPTFLATYRGKVLATAAAAAHSLYTVELSGPLAWVFGNEGQGIRPALLAMSDERVYIPMVGATESLNVVAAATVCLFETLRQRSASAASCDSG